jgi:GT2 family glycosyltransferase
MSRQADLSIVIPTFNNREVLARCLDSWEQYAPTASVELIVVEDGCRDDTVAFLEERSRTRWAGAHLRWVHEDNVHELRATNRGLREATAPLVMTWHDDMFLRASWLVPELLATFARYDGIGLLGLTRGLRCHPVAEPIARWEDLIDYSRLESTIGPRPFNWFRLYEVDAVIRPWVIRRVCLDRAGLLDPAFVPTGWDEADLAFRVRAAGWRVVTHGYERDGAFVHLGSSTFTKFTLNLDRDLQNGRLFHQRWDDAISRDRARVRLSWRRQAPLAGWWSICQQAGRFARAWRRPVRPAGEARLP